MRCCAQTAQSFYSTCGKHWNHSAGIGFTTGSQGSCDPLSPIMAYNSSTLSTFPRSRVPDDSLHISSSLSQLRKYIRQQNCIVRAEAEKMIPQLPSEILREILRHWIQDVNPRGLSYLGTHEVLRMAAVSHNFLGLVIAAARHHHHVIELDIQALAISHIPDCEVFKRSPKFQDGAAYPNGNLRFSYSRRGLRGVHVSLYGLSYSPSTDLIKHAVSKTRVYR